MFFLAAYRQIFFCCPWCHMKHNIVPPFCYLSQTVVLSGPDCNFASLSALFLRHCQFEQATLEASFDLFFFNMIAYIKCASVITETYFGVFLSCTFWQLHAELGFDS